MKERTVIEVEFDSADVQKILMRILMERHGPGAKIRHREGYLGDDYVFEVEPAQEPHDSQPDTEGGA